jgi:predicted HTH domain antitoxin
MGVVIPDEVLRAADLSPEEMRREVAVLLSQQERLSLGQASDLAGMDRLSFQQLLASRAIPIHYDVSELEADIETLRKLGQLP